jgi:hypothetical protein
MSASVHAGPAADRTRPNQPRSARELRVPRAPRPRARPPPSSRQRGRSPGLIQHRILPRYSSCQGPETHPQPAQCRRSAHRVSRPEPLAPSQNWAIRTATTPSWGRCRIPVIGSYPYSYRDSRRDGTGLQRHSSALGSAAAQGLREASSEGPEPPAFRSVARSGSSRFGRRCPFGPLARYSATWQFQRCPCSSRSVVSNRVSKIGVA